MIGDVKFAWRVRNLGMIVEEYVRVRFVQLFLHSAVRQFDGLPVFVRCIHRRM